MKICHLTSVHKPDDIRIFHKECSSLAKKYDVTLVAANGINDVVNNVKLINVLVGYSGRLQRFTKAVDAVYKKALETEADIYHLHDPELLRIALKLKKKGKKVIFDAHEDLPRQLLSKPYLNKWAAKLISKVVERYEDKVVSKLDGVIAATPHIKARFLRINPNTENINNFPLKEELSYTVSKQNDVLNKVCYVGGITQIRGIKEMVNAMELINEDVELELAGNFSPQSLQNQIEVMKGWKKVNYQGQVGREEVREIFNNCFAGLVVFYPVSNHIYAQPNKLFEYMAAGLSVIASDFPLWQEIIEKNNCGICVNPLKPDEIANAIDFLHNNPDKAKEMGERGKKLVHEK